MSAHGQQLNQLLSPLYDARDVVGVGESGGALLRLVGVQQVVEGLERRRTRLRHDRLAVCPAALEAFPELTASSALAFLERWPTTAAARDQSRPDSEALLRQQFDSQARVAAGRIHAALHAAALTAPPHLASVGPARSGRSACWP